MIVFLTFLFAIALFSSVMFSKQKWLSALMGLLFVFSTAITTLNYSQHFGMRKQTTTKTQKIYPAAGKLPIVLYQPIGNNGRDNVYIYKTHLDQKKPQHTQANEYTYSQLKYTGQSQAKLVTKETRWCYKNSFYRTLFMGAGLENKLVSRTNTLYYPKGYVKVSVKQMKKLQAALKSAPTAPSKAFSSASGSNAKQLQAAMIKQALKSTN